MKSGRHIASIWEALGSVVAPLGVVVCPSADSDCNNSAQKCPKDNLGDIMNILIFLYVFYVVYEDGTSRWTSK